MTRPTPEWYSHMTPEELQQGRKNLAFKASERRHKCAANGCLTCQAATELSDWALAEQIYGKPEPSEG